MKLRYFDNKKSSKIDYFENDEILYLPKVVSKKK